MNKLLFIIALLFFARSYSQKNIKIIFEEQMLVKEESLIGVPEHLRAKFVKQVESIKSESYMYIQNGKVYFESKHTNKEVKDKSIVNAKGSKEGVLFVKDMSSSVNVSEVKMAKDPKTNTYIIQENKQLKSNKLPVVQWRITNKQKKILGYDCHEAFTKYKNQTLKVYFTKEFNLIASPKSLPFINGVVLEYTYGPAVGKAVQVEMNQPIITNFFKY
jgi:GLPGLI family protein